MEPGPRRYWEQVGARDPCWPDEQKVRDGGRQGVNRRPVPCGGTAGKQEKKVIWLGFDWLAASKKTSNIANQ